MAQGPWPPLNPQHGREKDRAEGHELRADRQFADARDVEREVGQVAASAPEQASHGYCPHCGDALNPDMHFCPRCGNPLPASSSAPVSTLTGLLEEDRARSEALTEQLPIAAQTDATPAGGGDPPGNDGSSFTRHRRWWVVGGAAAAVVLLAGGVIGYNSYQQRQTHEQTIAAAYSASDSSLRSIVEQLTKAKTTAEVRTIATPAQPAADSFSASLPQMEAAESQRANNQRAALVAIGSLTALNADTLTNWPTMRQSLQAALASVQDERGIAGVSGGASAMSALDTMVATGVAKLKAWEAKNDAKLKSKQAELAALDRYVTKMRSSITAYEALRNDTSADLDAMRNAGPTYYYSTAYANFGKARDARMAVRSDMQGLSPPSALGGSHSAILAATSHGIAGMNQLLAALDQNQMCGTDYYCGLDIETAWSDFQTTSRKVTSEFDRATDSWQENAAATQVRIKSRGLPPKPEV